MDKSITIKEAMQGIESLSRSVKWDKEHKQSIAYFIFDGENVMCNILGHCDCAAASIATAMVSEKDFRDILLTAHNAYINYMANKLAPAILPIAKYLEKSAKEMLGGQCKESPICLESAKFTKQS